MVYPKRIIISVAIGENPLYQKCIESQKRYASEVGIEYKLITESKSEFANHLHLNKLQLVPYLENNCEVLFLDADVYIRPKASNVFDRYSIDHSDLVVFNETQIISTNKYVKTICRVCNFNIKRWPKTSGLLYNYYNTGVMLIRPTALAAFKKFDLDFYLKTPLAQHLYEQTYLNYLFVKNGLRISSLDLKYNHFYLAGWRRKKFSEFIHFASINRNYSFKTIDLEKSVVHRPESNCWPDFREDKMYFESNNLLLKCIPGEEKLYLKIYHKKFKIIRFDNFIYKDARNGIYLSDIYRENDSFVYLNERFLRLKKWVGATRFFRKTTELLVIEMAVLIRQKLSTLKFILTYDKSFPFSWYMLKPYYLVGSFFGKPSAVFRLQRLFYLQRNIAFIKTIRQNGWMIVNGLFKGFKFHHSSLTESGSQILPKLAGTYESEISETISDLFRGDPEVFLNIGCGEGYYLLNFARFNKKAKIIGVDPSKDSLYRLEKNKSINNIKNEIELLETIDEKYLSHLGSTYNYGIVICDCEGCEAELFNEAVFNSLQNFHFIIETHDFVKAGVTDSIVGMLKKTHKVEIVTSIPDLAKPNIVNPEILSNDMFHERLNILTERRPNDMKWLILSPIDK